MKKLLLTIAVLTAANILFAQGITNINSAQRTDGSMMVDVYYDLSGPDITYNVIAEASLDGGASFVPATGVSGDAGYGVGPGTGKHFIWNFGQQFPGEFSNQAQIKITAFHWICGLPLIATHTAGDIAPMTKTVAYETVPTNLTGSNHCWITQNLGADQQATSTTDDTEASAGWYWQFNRRQGYKHDGSALTPAWTITAIDENSYWLPSNEPCGLLLGNGWRLPTYTEWLNADVNGGWNSYDDTYSGVLKLHAAGCLYSDGSLNDRGVYGNYWSSTQKSDTHGWYLTFYSNFSNMYYSSKAVGFSARCLQDDPSAWSCGDPLLDVRDSQTYPTVQIGTQCWMAANLNVGTMIQGTSNPANNSIIEKYCYSNDTANCDTYGGLYQWDEMMGYTTTPGVQGICPEGWYIPTDEELMTLEEEVESTTGVNWNTTEDRGTDAGGNLKETGTSHWISPNTGATNASGFTSLPGGFRYTEGWFNNPTIRAYLWSSSEDGTNAWYRYLTYNSAQVGRYRYDKAHGFSVRCLHD